MLRTPLCLTLLATSLGFVAAQPADPSIRCRSPPSPSRPGARHTTHRHTSISSEMTVRNTRSRSKGMDTIRSSVSANLGSAYAVPAPIALFLDGLPQGHGPDPKSGSDYVWSVTGQQTFAQYTAGNIYLYAGSHTMGLQCLACSWSTTVALVSAVSVELTSTAAPPSEPAGSRDPTVQPLRSYNIWNTAIGSGAVWSNTDDPDTQAIISSASGATINSGCWSIPVYIAKTSDPFGYFAAPTRNTMPINNGYYTQLAPDVLPSCGSDRDITLYDSTHRYMQEFQGCSRDLAPAAGYQCYDNLLTDVCEGQNPTGTFTSWTPGLIRVSEIQRGLIPHMLSFAMPTTMTKPPAKWWQVAWPEFQVDVCGPTCYSGVVPAGSTIGIPSTVNLGDTRTDTCWFSAGHRFAGLRRNPAGDRWPALGGDYPLRRASSGDGDYVSVIEHAKRLLKDSTLLAYDAQPSLEQRQRRRQPLAADAAAHRPGHLPAMGSACAMERWSRQPRALEASRAFRNFEGHPKSRSQTSGTYYVISTVSRQ